MEFRHECGRCGNALAEDQAAYWCARGCTYCASCYRRLKFTCPNCSGELVRRPRPGPLPTVPGSPPVASRDTPSIRRAGPDDVQDIAPLFDAYRQFYEQSPNLGSAARFLHDRLERDESVVFVAEQAGKAVGFVQLYPLFSSVSLGRIYLLNDLFVAPEARGVGVGAALLETSRCFGEAERAHYLELSTAVDNPAQRLYEACGWQRDREFLFYELSLPARAT